MMKSTMWELSYCIAVLVTLCRTLFSPLPSIRLIRRYLRRSTITCGGVHQECESFRSIRELTVSWGSFGLVKQ